jgi:hypothetical protein
MTAVRTSDPACNVFFPNISVKNTHEERSCDIPSILILTGKQKKTEREKTKKERKKETEEKSKK